MEHLTYKNTHRNKNLSEIDAQQTLFFLLLYFACEKMLWQTWIYTVKAPGTKKNADDMVYSMECDDFPAFIVISLILVFVLEFTCCCCAMHNKQFHRWLTMGNDGKISLNVIKNEFFFWTCRVILSLSYNLAQWVFNFFRKNANFLFNNCDFFFLFPLFVSKKGEVKNQHKCEYRCHVPFIIESFHIDDVALITMHASGSIAWYVANQINS